MTLKPPSTEMIWKVALSLVGYIILGMWLTAKISVGYDFIRADVQRLEQRINTLTNRIDQHIDSTK